MSGKSNYLDFLLEDFFVQEDLLAQEEVFVDDFFEQEDLQQLLESCSQANDQKYSS